jgi:hypothetical protein
MIQSMLSFLANRSSARAGVTCVGVLLRIPFTTVLSDNAWAGFPESNRR